MAGGDGASAATLLEESVRILDVMGLGGTGPALTRMERLAQVQGGVLGRGLHSSTSQLNLSRI